MDRNVGCVAGPTVARLSCQTPDRQRSLPFLARFLEIAGPGLVRRRAIGIARQGQLERRQGPFRLAMSAKNHPHLIITLPSPAILLLLPALPTLHALPAPSH